MIPGLNAFNITTSDIRTSSHHLLDAINELGISTGLKTCLDIGDSNCVSSGSSQTVTDLSGNANNWYRGATGSSESTDPTFSGTAGDYASNTFYYVDSSADKFTFTGTTPTWINNLHKDGAKYAFLYGVRCGNLSYSIDGFSSEIFNSMDSSTNTAAGIRIGINQTVSGGKGPPSYGNTFIAVGNGTSTSRIMEWQTSPLIYSYNFYTQWIVVDEAANMYWRGNGFSSNVVSSTGASYTSPTTANAASVVNLIKNYQGADSTPKFGLGFFAAWEGTIPDPSKLATLAYSISSQRPWYINTY